MLRFDQAVLLNQRIPVCLIGAVEAQLLAGHNCLLTHLIELAHPHQLDLDWGFDHAHFYAFFVLSGLLQLFGADMEVLL
ncbi:hypothetical protein D3C80_1988390 [compost metagenome]